MLFFAFFSSIYTFYINKKWYFRNLLSKIPFCQQSETRNIKLFLVFLSVYIFSISSNDNPVASLISKVVLPSDFNNLTRDTIFSC